MRQIATIIMCYSLCLNPVGGVVWAANSDVMTEGDYLGYPTQKIAKVEVVTHSTSSTKSQAKPSTWRGPVLAAGMVVAVIAGVVLLAARKQKSGLGGQFSIADLSNFQAFASQDQEKSIVRNDLGLIQSIRNPMDDLQKLSGVGSQRLDWYGGALCASFARVDPSKLPPQLQYLTAQNVINLKQLFALIEPLKQKLITAIDPEAKRLPPLKDWGEILQAAADQKLAYQQSTK
jgi:hypothetical protein